VPAALAVAERRGGVDGRTLITAVAVGDEIVCRLGRALARRAEGLPLDRWFLTSVLGAFGATAACCRVLGADADTTRNALGIVLFQAGGTLEAFSPTGQTAMVRGMIAGFAAQSAVLAALMAAEGITGVPDSLEGRFGLFPAYFGGGHDRDALLGSLGHDWAVEDLAVKAWPTVRYASSYVDAIRRLVQTQDLPAERIAEIRVHVAGYAATRCEPLDRQRRPANYDHAGHALPYLVAAMATHRRLGVEDLSTGLDDPAVLALAQRVVPVHDPAFGGDNRLGPAKVVVVTRDGRALESVLSWSYGDPRDPMSREDLVAKFRACLALHPRFATETRQQAAVEALSRLAELDDVGVLTRSLA
jgi:2-methylcitrate dehydratase PrpD